MIQYLTSGFAACAFALGLASAWNRDVPANLRWSLTIFCVSWLTNFLRIFVLPNLFSFTASDPVYWLMFILGCAQWAWFLLLMLVLFEDRRLGPALFIPAAVKFALHIIYVAVLHDSPQRTEVLSILRQASIFWDVMLTAAALLVVLRSWRDDLIQRRRMMRSIVFAAGSLQGLLYAALWFPITYGRMNGEWVQTVDMWLDVLLVFSAAAVMFGLHPELIAARAGAARQRSDSLVGESSRRAIARLRATNGPRADLAAPEPRHDETRGRDRSQ